MCMNWISKNGLKIKKSHHPIDVISRRYDKNLFKKATKYQINLKIFFNIFNFECALIMVEKNERGFCRIYKMYGM